MHSLSRSAALYTADNLQQMAQLRWVSRVPATLKCAKDLLQNIHPDAFVPSSLAGYQIAACCNCYASIPQRWLVVKSQARLESDLKQLEKRLAKHEAKARAALQQLQSQKFACQPDALTAAASRVATITIPSIAGLTNDRNRRTQKTWQAQQKCHR